ncbi:cell wall-binding repeat-containing protein [Candidatus Poriferisodalis sp.]|uniref:cell wall-binding repeat-containing protein n=1 Tax=Candidatus Poriferisodalis sp. TaxID=3101277 RepID=UPI003B019D1B
MRRLLAAMAAVATAVSGVLTLPVTAGAESASGDLAGVEVNRYGGADRYATSLEVAEEFVAQASAPPDAVVLASGESWFDAVVAAPFAGSIDAPLLMTPPGELRDDAAGFLERIGASEVFVVSADRGPHAVGPAVISGLADLGIRAQRVTGLDRYATGAAAARRIDEVGTMPGLGRTAIVASGEVFADALVAGPLAAHGPHPVLLTPPGELHPEAAVYLREAGIEHVVLMGGTAALTATVETSLRELGLSVTRLAGATRFDTAVQAAQLAAERYGDSAGGGCFAGGRVGLARADVPFDSFGAGPLLGRLCAPLLLTEPATVPPDTAAHLDGIRASLGADATIELLVFGGEAAVAQTALDAYLRGESGDDVEDDDSTDPSGLVRAVLPPGTCGGRITDPPRQLLDSRSAERAAWSSDCEEIHYVLSSSLWNAKQDGSEPTSLLHDPDIGLSLRSAVWSPDGSQIAYVQREDGTKGYLAHIWTANADGSRRTQLTDGQFRDYAPTWSPDGETIAYVRTRQEELPVSRGGTALFTVEASIVTMDRGGRTQSSAVIGAVVGNRLAWSPDGSQIAFVQGSALVLLTVDGSSTRTVLAGASGLGGLSWSPDGRRIAYVRYDHTKPTQRRVMVAEVEGSRHELVAEVTGSVPAVDWSPDGQLLLYSVRDGGERRVYVAGAGAGQLSTESACRPRAPGLTTTGFPIQSEVPTTGTLRVALLFMDFPNAQATYSTHDELEHSLPRLERYLESASYGKLDIEWIPLHRWLRAEEATPHYIDVGARGSPGLAIRASAHAISLADEFFDFSTTPAVLTVFPSSRFGGGNAGGRHEVDGVEVMSARVNTYFGSDRGRPGQWGRLGAHELAHLLGLDDLYAYDDTRLDHSPAPAGQWRVATNWGLMGLETSYLTHERDDRLMYPSWNHKDGFHTAYTTGLQMAEMLGWSRWQLDWLDASQVQCVTDAKARVELAPIARPGDEVALAVIPLNFLDVIVVESRRRLGYDRNEEYTASNGFEVSRPNLIDEGVVVYTVETATSGGDLPVKIAGDRGDGRVGRHPILTEGESLTVRGYTITVTGDDGERHTVSIRRNDAG